MLNCVESELTRTFNECLKAIEEAEECAKSKEIVEEEVLESLKSLKDFLISENIFYKLGTGVDLVHSLKNNLKFFSKRKRYIRFKEWDSYYQELLSIMKAKVIDDDDWDSIQKIREYSKSVPTDAPYTLERICSKIHYEILKFKIESKYVNNYDATCLKNKIALYEFVGEKVKSFGNSDSYMAQFYYKKVLFDLMAVNELYSYTVRKLLLDLEICRCVVKESKNSEKELLKEYDFSFCGLGLSDLADHGIC